MGGRQTRDMGASSKHEGQVVKRGLNQGFQQIMVEHFLLAGGGLKASHLDMDAA